MPLSRYTVRQLEAFSAVADLLSFSSAAERLALTPSAISQLVTELESALDFKLFERTTRRVTLSPAGREFLASVEVVLRDLRLAERAASDVRNRAAGLVRVAAPMVVAATLLPAAIGAYARKRPNVIVRIRDVSVDMLVDSVAGGDADMAIGPDRVVGDEVSRKELFASPWVLWCARNHPLARKRVVRWSDLRNERLIAAGLDHERSVAQMRANLPEGERIAPVEIVDHISTALGVAAEGLAATLSPAYVKLWADQMGLAMRRIVDPEVMRYVCLYRPAGRSPSPASEGFAEHIIDTMSRPPRRRPARPRPS